MGKGTDRRASRLLEDTDRQGRCPFSLLATVIIRVFLPPGVNSANQIGHPPRSGLQDLAQRQQWPRVTGVACPDRGARGQHVSGGTGLGREPGYGIPWVLGLLVYVVTFELTAGRPPTQARQRGTATSGHPRCLARGLSQHPGHQGPRGPPSKAHPQEPHHGSPVCSPCTPKREGPLWRARS